MDELNTRFEQAIAPAGAVSLNSGYAAVALDQKQPPSDPRMDSMLHLLSLAYQSMQETLSASAPSGTQPLTSREIEVLTWFAQGKSAEDVAGILGISMSTVMFHYRRAAEQFGTLNRTHTVVEAIRRGLIRC